MIVLNKFRLLLLKDGDTTEISSLYVMVTNAICTRVVDMSLARSWKGTSYSDQYLQHNTKTYGVQTTGIYSCCLYAISLGVVL